MHACRAFISHLWLYLANCQVSVYRTIGPLVVQYLDNELKE